MKRFHVHVSVDDLDANVRFYSTVFGAPPTVLKPDYAKWMMEDPRMKQNEEMPFDGKRMIIGGFAPILDTNGELVT